MTSQIRAARLADAAAIARVHVAAWRWAYAGLMPAGLLAGLDESARTQQWQRQLSAGNTAVLVSEDEAGIHGFVSSGPSRDPAGVGEVYAIYLLQPVQGTGVGKRLWLGSLEWLRAQDFDRLLVWVLDTNDLARGFYESAGLVADGGRKTSQWAGTSLNEVRYSGPLT